MSYVLVDIHGSSLASYEDRGTAIAAYKALIVEDPDARDETALLIIDPTGRTTERLDAAVAGIAA